MRDQTTESTFDVPEFFETNISTETALGDVIVRQLQADLIGYDRRLAHGNIGKRTCMDQDGLTLQRLK